MDARAAPMIVLHGRRVRARIAAPARRRRETASPLGRGLRRIPSLRGRDQEQLGRCGAYAAAGALALATSTHGARALAAIPLGAWAGWNAGRALHDRRRRAAAAEAAAALPTVIDRLRACVLAGMSIEGALRLVAPGTPGRLGEALAEGLRALDLGIPRARAYELIAQHAGADEVRALTNALARAERFGTSVSAVLSAQAEELRHKARSAAEAEARTAPVKLIFPLVFCFLPAFVLLTIAPIAISAFQALSGI